MVKPRNPPNALPPPTEPAKEAPAEDPNPAPKPESKPGQKTPWMKMFFNLGAFIAGATAGYFFSKAEDKFTSYGENIVIQILQNLRKEKGYGGGGAWRKSTPDFSDRRPRGDHDSNHDPMGDSRGPDIQEDDRI
jgi:hypothetical protein